MDHLTRPHNATRKYSRYRSEKLESSEVYDRFIRRLLVRRFDEREKGVSFGASLFRLVRFIVARKLLYFLNDRCLETRPTVD